MIIQSISEIKSLPAPALGLLPAVHDATVENYTAGVLPAVGAGQVFINNTGQDVVLPGFGSWPPQKVAQGGYAACDGRFWFPARRYEETNSYYPQAFERTLYTLAFTANSLPLGGTFTLSRLLKVRLLANNTDVVWNWVWEVGMRVAETTPAPIGPNIDTYVWRTPLIDEQVHVTDIVSTHEMGVELRRSLSGTDEVWAGNVARYAKVLAAQSEQLPTGTDFVLRLRLSCFDTQNEVASPRGFVAYFCTAPEDK